MTPRVVAPSGTGEIEVYAHIVHDALGFPRLDERRWIDDYERSWFRVVRLGLEVVGGLVSLPVAQYFGGHPVPSAGIHAVAVRPEHRGRGAATELVREHVRELHRGGVALSVLYPATQPVYRAAGYEQAGTHVRYRMPLAAIGERDRGLEVVRSGPDDLEAIERVYRDHARRNPGHLERIAWSWNRQLGKADAEVFRVKGDSGDEGYAIVTQRRTGALHRWTMRAELVGLTGAAWRRLAALVGDYGSMIETLTFTGAPGRAPVLTWPLREQHGIEIDQLLRWMVRIVHVPAAIEARGYPTGLEAELDLDLRDPLVPDNAGRWRLRVAGGAATLEPGGDGELSLDVRALAPLYTGYASAHVLAAAGLLEGPPDALATATAIFAGPSPWLPEIF